MDGKKLFRQYERVDGENFLKFLKEMKRKLECFILFMDKSTPHRKDKDVGAWLKDQEERIQLYGFQRLPRIQPS